MDIASIVIIGLALALVAFAALAVVSTVVAANRVEVPLDSSGEKIKLGFQERLDLHNRTPVKK